MKVGKTTFAAQCEKNLIFAFEKGTNFLNNVYMVPIPKWTDFKALLKQLEKPEIQEKFNTITIDTVGIAWSLCEQYICQQRDVKSISEIEWGKGYAMLTAEFSDALRKISMLGYGIILIAHAKEKNESTTIGGEEAVITKISPDIPDRAKAIVNALVDIIGYIDVQFNSNGYSERTLVTRATPTIMAGSRLKYLEAQIPFGYNELVNAIGEAIEKQKKFDNAEVTDYTLKQEVIKSRPFAETVEEARQLWTALIKDNEHNAEKIMQKMEVIFGTTMKLSEIPESKQDQFELLIEEMKAL